MLEAPNQQRPSLPHNDQIALSACPRAGFHRADQSSGVGPKARLAPRPEPQYRLPSPHGHVALAVGTNALASQFASIDTISVQNLTNLDVM